MFELDKSLSCIDVAESDLLEIYRSTASVAVAPDNLKPLSCDAFVCAVRRNESYYVYVALQPPDKRRLHVFTRGGDIGVADSHAEPLREALDFASTLGFRMKEVNLNYSKALREVVVRDLRILRRTDDVKVMAAPVPVKDLEVGGPAPDETGDGNVELQRAAAMAEDAWGGETEKKDERRSAVERKAAEEAAAIELGALKAGTARISAETEAAVKAAELEIARLREDNRRLAAEKRKAEKEAAAECAALKEEAARLTAESEAAEKVFARKAAPVRKEIERLKEESAKAELDVAEELTALKEEAARLSAGKKSADKALAAEVEVLKAEIERLVALKKDADAAAVEETSALKARIAELGVESEGAGKAAAAEIARLEAEAERLAAEKETLEKEFAAQHEMLREIVERRTAEKEAARRETHERLARLLAEEALLEAEMEALESAGAGRRGDGALEAERKARKKAEVEVSLLREELDRLAAVKAVAEQSAAAEIAALKVELGRLVASASAVVTVPLPAAAPGPDREVVVRTAPMSQPDEHPRSVQEPKTVTPAAPAPPVISPLVVADVEEEEPDAAAGPVGFPDAAAGEDPFAFGADDGFSSFGADEPSGEYGPPVAFRLDKTLENITYDTPGDVLELHQALNHVNITPEGHSPQTCGAYICAVRKGEEHLVYVAWLLTQSNESLVYVPEAQPADAGSCRKIVRDAFAFVETVGFMMDEVRLSADEGKRAKALGKIPVMRGGVEA